MNLTYIKEFLKARKETISQEDIEELIKEIDSFQGTENNFTDISKIMRTINEYNISFLAKVQEYEAFPKDDTKLLPKRMEKVRDILYLLSMLHTYLVLSVSTVSSSTYDMRNVKNYLRDLAEKKEHFKSEKMTWGIILKSLIQEASYIVVIRRLDLQDQIGYIKK